MRVGKADDRHVGHRRVGVEQVLHLLGRDVLAVADDHVLQPPGDGHVALGVDDAEVAAAEVPVLVEGVGVERGVEVAADDLGALEPDLPLLVRARPAARRGRTTISSTPGVGRPSVSASFSSGSSVVAMTTMGASVSP